MMPINSEGYDWEKDKVNFMFVNMEHQGEDMSFGVNTAPRAVFNALQVERTEFKVEGEKEKSVTPYQKKLYFTQIVADKEEKLTGPEKAKNEIMKEAAADVVQDKSVPKPKAQKPKEE
jgi:hypothetical protein